MRPDARREPAKLQRGVGTVPGGHMLVSATPYLLYVIVALTILAPLLYMLSTSLKTLLDSMKYPPDLIPDQPVWRNYVDVWSTIPLAQLFVNSVKVTGPSVIGTLVTCSLAGYAFARLKFWGRDVLFVLLLATLMIPYQVTLVPTFLFFNEAGLVNTYVPLILPNWLAPAFGIFLMRQFFRTIPRELEDAAKLDGCAPIGIYWHIFLPLSGPPMAALVIFEFLRNWNNFLLPLVFLQEPEKMTLPVGLAWLSGQHFSNVPLMMTVTTISSLPTIVLFVFLQKYFVKGVVLTGLRG